MNFVNSFISHFFIYFTEKSINQRINQHEGVRRSYFVASSPDVAPELPPPANDMSGITLVTWDNDILINRTPARKREVI